MRRTSTGVSKRKPHNQDAGYVAERQFNGSHIVIYVADEQGFDVGGAKYAVVCSKHSTLWGAASIPKARVMMKFPEFCEECMQASGTGRAAESESDKAKLTYLRILYKGSEACIWLAATFDQLCTWVESLLPDEVAREAAKAGSLFYKDYESSALIHYSPTMPRVTVRYWEGDEAEPYEKIIEGKEQPK